MSQADWDSEFSLYRASPEFKLLNPQMTLSEFKSIYYMEWGHRLWGRVVGLSFVLPAVYFVVRRKVTKNMAWRLLGISGLIGVQGGIGWWMVKSGLKDDLFAPGSHPRVSQYRLTAHLGTAFICYTAMLTSALSILRERNYLIKMDVAEAVLNAWRKLSPQYRLFRRSVGALAILVFVTAMSGGLVAGLDAGMIYNQFPYMGEGFAPPTSELFNKFYSRREDGSDIWWRNMLENPSTVQLDHRILATTTFTSIMALWAYTKYSPSLKKVGGLMRPMSKGMHGVVGFVFLQVALGISTLLYLVPVPLAAAHQAGSLALLTTVLILRSRTALPKGLIKRIVARKMPTRRLAAARKESDLANVSAEKWTKTDDEAIKAYQGLRHHVRG
jgi:heme a synthase